MPSRHASPAATCAPTSAPPPLPRNHAEALARWLKALSDPTRLQILALINATPSGELCVCDLTESFDVTQPAISHHLKVLVDAGVLQREKRGSWAWYSFVPAQADAIRRVLPAGDR